MKVLLIGANGDVGKAANTELSVQHQIIKAGRGNADIYVDIGNSDSIAEMFEQSGEIDAVVCAAGAVHFAPLSDFTHSDFMIGLENKVMGQINLVLLGQKVLNDGGSFTLTSGVLDRDPIRSGAGAATANGAIAGFVKAAAIELGRGHRINAVSPGLLEASEQRYGVFFAGHERVPSERVGRAFLKSVEGALTGQVIKVA